MIILNFLFLLRWLKTLIRQSDVKYVLMPTCVSGTGKKYKKKTLSSCSDNLGKDKGILQYNLKRAALEAWIPCYRKTEVNATNDALDCQETNHSESGILMRLESLSRSEGKNSQFWGAACRQIMVH